MLHKSIVDVGGVPLRVSSDCRGGGGGGGGPEHLEMWLIKNT